MLDIYLSWAEKRNMRVEVLRQDNQQCSAWLSISGFGALALLREEAGLHVLELESERGRPRVAGEGGLLPRRAARGEVAAERPELLLRRRLGEELDDLPRVVLPRRGSEDDEARPSGERDAGPRHPVGRRKRRRRPGALEARREPAPETTPAKGFGAIGDYRSNRPR